MKLLVTGCAGFIGSNLCEAVLQKGHEIIGIDNFDPFYNKEIKVKNLEGLLKNKSFRFFECDFTDKNGLQVIPDFDLVVHLAAKAGVRPSISDPGAYVQSNIQGTLNIIELALSKKIYKMVFASSSSVYGNDEKVPFAEEAQAVQPISPYAFTKRSCELMLYNYFHLYQLSSISLRFFTVYGPRQRPDLAIYKFFKAIHSGNPITVFGNGDTYRDYTFINDIVAGVISAIDLVADSKPLYEIINLGNHQPTRLIELIRLIEKTAGKKAELIFSDYQPGDVDRTYASIEKAKRLLNFEPATSMEKGLKVFNEWFEVHGSK